MTKVLIVEDDNDINNLLKELLEDKYQVTQAFAGSEAKRLLDNEQFDLVVLDLMLPGITGEELIVAIRKTSKVPIIVITAKTEVSVLVDVLKIGADDYIAKPFNNMEVLARIEKLLINSTDEQPLSLINGPFTVDERTHTVLYKDNKLDLTIKEYEMLKLFIKDPMRVYTKANLYEHVWGDTYYGDDNTISVHISRLRAKLKEVSGDELIETVWGIGFKMTI